MQLLYPELKPYHRHQFKVSDLHQLYVDESGNPDGIPVVFVHGGPGAACDASCRRYYDPSVYRIITFDQRGCGRSTPHAELKHNNTQLLIADMESIRQFLKVDKWLLFGGSWGATLSLLYAQQHPENVLGLILRGVFLCRQRDIDWLYKDGANRIFPDHWQKFIHAIPESERDDMLGAYHRRLVGPDELARMAAAKAWSAWEGNCATLRPNTEVMTKLAKLHVSLAMARLESEYMINAGFIAENQILDNMKSIEQIPAIIVHGRYDMVCPLENALSLHDLWPVAELHIIRDAGHSASEPGITDALVRSTAEMADTIGDDF